MCTLALYVPLDFLPDAMKKEHGISQTKSGNIIAFFGASSTIGPILSGLFTNYLRNKAVLLTGVCMILLGACCVGMALSLVYWQFVMCAFMYGLFLFTIFVLLPISLVDMFGIKSLKPSYSVIMFLNGIASLIGPPMVGEFKAIWGSYDIAFNITGGFYFLGGIIAFVVLWIQFYFPSYFGNSSTYTVFE